MDEKLTGLDIKFELYKIAHDLPEIPLITWTFHDKPSAPGQRVIRMTSVSALVALANSDLGGLFTGISACSDGWTANGYITADQFNRKDAFNRAYGKACQKVAAFYRGMGEADAKISLTSKRSDIDRWVANHSFQAKLNFIKSVYTDRMQLAQMKGKVYVPGTPGMCR